MPIQYEQVLGAYSQTSFIHWLGKTYGNDQKKLARQIFDRLTKGKSEYKTFDETYSNGVHWEKRGKMYAPANLSVEDELIVQQIQDDLESTVAGRRQNLWDEPTYSMTSVIRWFYHAGYSREELLWFLDEVGLTPASNTITCQFDSPSHRDNKPVAPISAMDKQVIADRMAEFRSRQPGEPIGSPDGTKEGGTRVCIVTKTIRGNVRAQKLRATKLEDLCCECCGEKPHLANGNNLAVYAVDHIVPLSKDRERVRYTKNEDLRIVCWNCHATFTWGRVSFEALRETLS